MREGSLGRDFLKSVIEVFCVMSEIVNLKLAVCNPGRIFHREFCLLDRPVLFVMNRNDLQARFLHNRQKKLSSYNVQKPPDANDADFACKPSRRRDLSLAGCGSFGSTFRFRIEASCRTFCLSQSEYLPADLHFCLCTVTDQFPFAVCSI